MGEETNVDSDQDCRIAYEHGFSRERFASWALHMGTFLRSRSCPSFGQALVIWAEEEDVDLELAEAQIERELPQMVPCGHEPRIRR